MFDLQINVEEEIKRFSRSFEGIARKQLPFAAALALTMTVKDAQKNLRTHVRQEFVTRSKWVERGIRIKAARKNNLVATVGSIDWFMADQATGGTRTPFKGKHRAAPLGVRKDIRQRITKAKTPGRLLKKPGRRRFFVNRLKRGARAGQLAVLRRDTKARYPLQVLYILEEKTEIKGRFRFRRTVERTVGQRLSKNFGAAMGRALATAR